MKGNTRNASSYPVITSDEEISQILANERKRLSIPIKTLANKVAVDYRYVHAILSGEAPATWPLYKLQKWAEALGLEVELRLRRKNVPPLYSSVDKQLGRVPSLYAFIGEFDQVEEMRVAREKQEIELITAKAMAAVAGGD